MIAGRCSDHAAKALLRAESEKFVQRGAFLEGAGTLLVVEFEEDGIVGKAGKRFRVRAGRDTDVGANSIECRLDVGKLDHDAGVIILPRFILAPLHLTLDRVRMVIFTRQFVERWKPKEQQGGAQGPS